MTALAPARRARLRRLALLLAVAGLLAVLLLRGTDRFLGGYGSLGSEDLVQYWAAGRLAWHGGNPYDAGALLAEERAAGMPREEPVLMWNPPWTLALVLPLAALPFEIAVAAALLVQLALLLACGMLLWWLYARGDSRYWIGALLAALFVPGLIALQMGQISPWLLAGAVGFLCLERRRRDLLAGVALALLMVKPHYTYLFSVAALWWAWRGRRPGVLLGFALAVAAASALVGLLAPRAWTGYLAAGSDPPLYWASTTLGAWLRLAFGEEQRWLQFLPTLLGLAGLAFWLWRRRGPWQWSAAATPLLAASAVTAAYGWTFDQVVLLAPVVDAVGRMRSAPPRQRSLLLLALGLFQAILLAQSLLSMSWFYNAWHPLAVACACALVLRRCPGGQARLQGGGE